MVYEVPQLLDILMGHFIFENTFNDVYEPLYLTKMIDHFENMVNCKNGVWGSRQNLNHFFSEPLKTVYDRIHDNL